MKLVYIATMNVQVLRVSNDRFCRLVQCRHCCNKLTPCSNAIHSVNTVSQIQTYDMHSLFWQAASNVHVQIRHAGRTQDRRCTASPAVVVPGVGRYVGFTPMWERTICEIRAGRRGCAASLLCIGISM